MKKGLAIMLIIMIGGCASHRKLEYVKRNTMEAQLIPTQEKGMETTQSKDTLHRDTMKVEDPDGHEMLIMKAIKDENGEMVATDVINAATVTAKFRNVAERHGKVELGFQVIVPKQMLDGKWQLRLRPTLRIMGDSTLLDPVIITGKEYRKGQLRGYQQYGKFLDSIISDSTRFINLFQLEIFIKRNIPQLYKFKTDSSFVPDAVFASAYGITEKNAIDHYTRRYLVRANEHRKEKSDKIFRKYVKVPMIKEGIRLDTVIQGKSGDFTYGYMQAIDVRPGMRKAEIMLGGEIFETDRKIYTIPESKPLAFYISSISSLVDNTERFVTKIIERKAVANTACYIDFRPDDCRIDPDLGNNKSETGRIRSNLKSLIDNEKYDIDSIMVTASCSPEGSYSHNRGLAIKRSESVSSYFKDYMRHYADSLQNEKMSCLYADEECTHAEEDRPEIRFISRSNPENWAMLGNMIIRDTALSCEDRAEYAEILNIADPDLREKRIRGMSRYKYLRTHIYPRLRTVRFDFFLHRKNMEKDTVHTTILDSTYMNGIQAIRDRDYKTALALLRPYDDFNTAIAFCAMDYDASAIGILSKMEKTDKVNYLLAILYARRGEERKAIQSYLKACRQNKAYVYRGNLDPEISVLINKYGLNEEEY